MKSNTPKPEQLSEGDSNARPIKFRAYQPHNSLHRKPGMYEVTDLVFYEGNGGGEAFLRGKQPYNRYS